LRLGYAPYTTNIFQNTRTRMELLDAFKYSLVLNVVTLAALVLVWRFAGSVTWVWIKSQWTRKPISLEWTKSKTWKFQIPNIPKGMDNVWELDGGNRIIEVRREAVGMAPNKTPMMLSTSEFPAAINPTEVHGNRFFKATESFYGYLFNDELYRVKEPTPEQYQKYKEFKEDTVMQEEMPEIWANLQKHMNEWKQAKLWVRYPEHGLDVSEFVRYQQVHADPKSVAQYAKRKELDAKLSLYSPFNVLSQNLHYLVPVIIVGFLGYILLQDHSMAVNAGAQAIKCNQDLAKCAADCTQYTRELIQTGTETVPTGGAIK